ncbi:hypothetical protein [Waddlia chondrophila]|uniref:Uncharacterized protein n=1 Tax=Waddlia chondrophila (strain ATCC VR-1470 / WSU 86-1044) TaxID=716544 RepID=D6YU21_WADCW|nr:hypothetical protein [Waddlia chondrophila]ADI37632.1 hypothetical protein wcw_0257 [Waddlia chondrophila WSU 86-1044]
MSAIASPVCVQSDPIFKSRSFLSKHRKWCVRVYRHHSDLIASLGIFTLNTILLASKIFKEIPHLIHRSCYTALSFSGMIWMNIQIRDLIKNSDDLYHNLKAKDWEGIIFTAAKVAVKSLNILLTGALLTASIFSLFAFPEIAFAMYAAMRPFSLFSLGTGILTEVYDYKKNSSLCARIKKVSEKQEVMHHFLKRLYHEKDLAQESSNKLLARHVFKQLDHYVMESMRKNLANKYGCETADHLMNKLDENDLNALFQSLKRGLKQKQQYIQANLGLITAGYISMGICKMWPDSLIQSSVTWIMSLLYTSKMIWQKSLHSGWSAKT